MAIVSFLSCLLDISEKVIAVRMAKSEKMQITSDYFTF